MVVFFKLLYLNDLVPERRDDFVLILEMFNEFNEFFYGGVRVIGDVSVDVMTELEFHHNMIKRWYGDMSDQVRAYVHS